MTYEVIALPLIVGSTQVIFSAPAVESMVVTGVAIIEGATPAKRAVVVEKGP
jgi:hypothetical protein